MKHPASGKIALRPTVVVIAGPNGAGKTTYAEGVLQALGIGEFVNADRIAQGLSGLNAESVALEAGRIMLKRLRTLATAGVSFGFESTLSSRSFAPFLRNMRRGGYAVRIFYVMVPSAAEAYRRVQRRVKMGGHDIPKDVVVRRFARSAANLFALYMPLANNWTVHENRTDALPVEVARGAAGEQPEVLLEKSWQKLIKIATNVSR